MKSPFFFLLAASLFGAGQLATAKPDTQSAAFFIDEHSPCCNDDLIAEKAPASSSSNIESEEAPDEAALLKQQERLNRKQHNKRKARKERRKARFAVGKRAKQTDDTHLITRKAKEDAQETVNYPLVSPVGSTEDTALETHKIMSKEAYATEIFKLSQLERQLEKFKDSLAGILERSELLQNLTNDEHVTLCLLAETFFASDQSTRLFIDQLTDALSLEELKTLHQWFSSELGLKIADQTTRALSEKYLEQALLNSQTILKENGNRFERVANILLAVKYTECSFLFQDFLQDLLHTLSRTPIDPEAKGLTAEERQMVFRVMVVIFLDIFSDLSDEEFDTFEAFINTEEQTKYSNTVFKILSGLFSSGIRELQAILPAQGAEATRCCL